MKKLLLTLLVTGLALIAPNTASAWFIDFEDGADGLPVNDILGISFQDFNGFDALYGDSSTDFYNTTSDDLGLNWNDQFYHHNGYFWLWAGPEADAQGVRVDFLNNDGTFFRTGYSSQSSFFVEAHLTDASIVSSSGASNLNNPMGFLQVDATAGQFIDYVILHDTGNFWLIDDVSGDATGVNPIPEPAPLALLGLGLAGLGLVRSRRRSS